MGEKPEAFVSGGYLFASAGYRLDSSVTPREQAESLADRLRAVGGEVTTVHEPDKTHMTLNRELGVAGDGPTTKVLEFLGDR